LKSTKVIRGNHSAYLMWSSPIYQVFSTALKGARAA